MIPQEGPPPHCYLNENYLEKVFPSMVSVWDAKEGKAERLINIENYHHHQEIKGKSLGEGWGETAPVYWFFLEIFFLGYN